MTPLEQILDITLVNVQKLLMDPRINVDVTAQDYDDSAYQASQFKHIYDDVAYNADRSRKRYRGSANPQPNETFYPLTENETLHLQDLRILEYIQLGFIPIEDIDSVERPSLYIANATDRHRPDRATGVTTSQVTEIIPLNFRLVTKEPNLGDLTKQKRNIIVVDKVLEGLKYVLDPNDYINLSFPRRGYDQPTVIRNIQFVQGLNLEEFADPYEVMDYLFHITVREQNIRD